eukprot:763663-Hanusia_phi.AAC.3
MDKQQVSTSISCSPALPRVTPQVQVMALVRDKDKWSRVKDVLQVKVPRTMRGVMGVRQTQGNLRLDYSVLWLLEKADLEASSQLAFDYVMTITDFGSSCDASELVKVLTWPQERIRLGQPRQYAEAISLSLPLLLSPADVLSSEPLRSSSLMLETFPDSSPPSLLNSQTSPSPRLLPLPYPPRLPRHPEAYVGPSLSNRRLTVRSQQCPGPGARPRPRILLGRSKVRTLPLEPSVNLAG